ncbi:MAG: FAD-binding protein, partial [Anaerolineae bacterium]
MPKNAYDLIVIGSGGAGSTAATTAAGLGKRVALIERDKLGGTCL